MKIFIIQNTPQQHFRKSSRQKSIHIDAPRPITGSSSLFNPRLYPRTTATRARSKKGTPFRLAAISFISGPRVARRRRTRRGSRGWQGRGEIHLPPLLLHPSCPPRLSGSTEATFPQSGRRPIVRRPSARARATAKAKRHPPSVTRSVYITRQ